MKSTPAWWPTILRRFDLLPIERLAELVPAWVARYIDLICAAYRDQQIRMAATRAGEKGPPIGVDGMLVSTSLQRVLQGLGDRLDPHILPLIERMNTMDRERDEHLAAAIECAGPGIRAAVPALLDTLRAWRVVLAVAPVAGAGQCRQV